MDVDGQCSRRIAYVERDVVNDMERSPLYPGRRAARPLAPGARCRAVEDAYAVGGDGVVFRVSRFPIDLYGAHAHCASEIDIDFMPALSER